MLKALSRRLASVRLRATALVVLCAVVVAPLVMIGLSQPYEMTVSTQLQVQMDDARRALTQLTAEQAAPQARPDAIYAIARTLGLRVRILSPDAADLLQDHDALAASDVPSPLTGALNDRHRALILAHERELGALARRPEVAAARAGADARSCTFYGEQGLLWCTLATRIDRGESALTQDTAALVVLSGASASVKRSRDDARYHLLQLGAQVLFIALLLGLWLGWRFVKPLNHLRKQVLSRASSASISTRPVDVPGNDEVGDLARAFNTLLEAIEAQRQANVAFMADVAHEIKNPVAAIQASAESLEGARAIDEARQARLARVLRSSSARLDELVSRFLLLARAEAGLMHERAEPLDVAALVHQLAHTIAQDERYAQVRFDVDAPQSLRLEAARLSLEDALRNLIDNAASFALAGGGHVWLTLAADKAQVRIIVRDDGPGISADDLPRIFDRFFTRRADDRGTGLGLAMTRAIVRAHQGQIEVSALPGQGATFTVTLPREAKLREPSV